MAVHKATQTAWVKICLMVRTLRKFQRLMLQLRSSRSLKMSFSFKANIVARFVRPMMGFKVLAHINNEARIAKR